jgi:hypothetical protein
VRYATPEAGRVTLAVYDVLGRRVAVLADAVQPAGPHEATLNAEGLASGVYLVRLTTPTGRQTQRLTVVR